MLSVAGAADAALLPLAARRTGSPHKGSSVLQHYFRAGAQCTYVQSRCTSSGVVLLAAMGAA